jgi:hypothetical protein
MTETTQKEGFSDEAFFLAGLEIGDYVNVVEQGIATPDYGVQVLIDFVGRSIEEGRLTRKHRSQVIVGVGMIEVVAQQLRNILDAAVIQIGQCIVAAVEGFLCIVGCIEQVFAQNANRWLIEPFLA